MNLFFIGGISCALSPTKRPHPWAQARPEGRWDLSNDLGIGTINVN